MKRSLLVVSLMVVLTLVLAACGTGEPANELEAVREEGKMVVGTSADFPPYEYVEEDGSFAGFDIALIQEIGDRMDLEVEIVDMPFDSLLSAVQEGKIDLTIAALNYTEERAEQVDFTDPYQTSQTVLVVREGFEGELNTKEQVAQYNLGSQTGTTGDDWVTEELIEPGLMPEDQMFRYERVDQGLLDLKAERLDVYLTDQTPAEAYASQMGELEVLVRPDFFDEKPMNIAVPKGADELREALNEVIAELHDEGVIEELKLEWIYGD